MDRKTAVEVFARVGYFAKGVVYMLIAALAAGAALGNGRAGDSREALSEINTKPFGNVLLGLIGAGLIMYALWRWYSGIRNPEDKKPLTRVGYVGTGLINFGIAVEALRLALTRGNGNPGNQAPHWTSEAMSQPMGVWLVAGVAAGIALYGLAQIVRAFRDKLDKKLHLGELDSSTRVWVRRSARAGISARGLVFSVAGLYLMKAAWEQDPSQARDLGASLQVLQQQPFGHWLLAGVAVGLFLYGFYNLVRARYRVIGVV
jgi:uncharacterized membrane protein YidH (DUF202 family)